MEVSVKPARALALTLFVLTFGFAAPAAAAASITIGEFSLGPVIEWLPWGERGTIPIQGSLARVTNSSPVTFLSVEIQAGYADVGVSGHETCLGLTTAAGAASTCTTGPLAPAPPGFPYGIGYYGT